LHGWWLGICSYHALQCWHHVTSSQFDLKSVLALLLRTESFRICPAPQKKEKKRKEHHNQTFKTKAIENQLKNQTFQNKKAMENQPN
jgi:hypothetical protein